MDLMVTSSISSSTLLHSAKSSEYALRQDENIKFSKDLRSPEPLQQSASQRFIPLVMNQCGRRGAHFNATLLEFATLLVKRSSGRRLLQGSFAVPPATCGIVQGSQRLGLQTHLGRPKGACCLGH